MSNKKIQLKDKDGNNVYPTIVKQCILDVVYPVGSIYISTKHTNPHDLFGGTWARIKDGFLYCTVRTDGTDGVIQDHLNGDTRTKGHAISINEMPSHNHSIKRQVDNNSGMGISVGSGGSTLFYQQGNDVTTNNTGGNQEHAHYIPYSSVYVWYRTA